MVKKLERRDSATETPRSAGALTRKFVTETKILGTNVQSEKGKNIL